MVFAKSFIFSFPGLLFPFSSSGACLPASQAQWEELKKVCCFQKKHHSNNEEPITQKRKMYKMYLEHLEHTWVWMAQCFNLHFLVWFQIFRPTAEWNHYILYIFRTNSHISS